MDMVIDKVSWILGVLAGFAVVADAVQKLSSRPE
jgi:hypothetical protein